ncbi:hypothetical protein GQ55_5G242000 [Panicum hallii var. hallii]|uniref:Uncharacterized protein n=1 Tax=Panicum hallii var. hallii TaxID=1504633 RepID=A0A2T7DJR5_9POAL|nr:hypothetical protein GQ55_5G242000 [Panicum hallii var. hallii]
MTLLLCFLWRCNAVKDELFIGVKSRCGLQGSGVSNSIGPPQSLVNHRTPRAGKRDCGKHIRFSSYSTLVTGEVFFFSRTIFFFILFGVAWSYLMHVWILSILLGFFKILSNWELWFQSLASRVPNKSSLLRSKCRYFSSRFQKFKAVAIMSSGTHFLCFSQSRSEILLECTCTSRLHVWHFPAAV